MNKKGFTLIELLAVIVILAIIALIATPIVLNIIKDSRESAGLRSAEMYLDAVEQSISVEKMKNTKFNPNECTITEKGNLDCDTKDGILEVKVNGDKPLNGIITFENGKIKDVSLEYSNEKIIVKNDEGKLVYKNYISINNFQHKHTNGTIEDHEVTFDNNGHGTCSKCGENVLAAGLYAEDGTMTKSWKQLITDGDLIVTDGVLVGGGLDNGCGVGHVFNGAGKLVIDRSVTAIGNYAFGCHCSCSKLLTEVIIPNSITSIGYGAFMNCTSLTTIEIPESVTSIDGYTFSDCTGLKNIEIPDVITSIENGAFMNCTSLTTIEIPNSVTNIGSNVFSGCTALTTITIPDGLTTINNATFKGCTSLKTIEIPKSVTSIVGCAFQGCTSLESIFIPKNVKIIKGNVFFSGATSEFPPFGNCSSTLKIYTEVKEDEIPSEWGQYWYYTSKTETLNVTYGVTREEYEKLINE